MFFQRQQQRIQGLYKEYPRQFWILIFGSFIDQLGGALMFPFFTLYITDKFGVGMTEVGLIFALFSISSVVGSMLGGALTDRMGRKGMLLFGLVMSAMSSLLMGVVDRIELFAAVALLVGLLANSGGPARQAMVADLLPDEKRAQGFGILRVVANLAITIGPLIGGLLALRSFMLLFIFDAVASLVTAGIAYFALDESRPADHEDASRETMAQTFGGYFDVVRDGAFLWFLMASALMVLVYMQMNTTLAVYLRDTHGLTTQTFSYILSLNAGMVVLLQFPITRWVTKYRPLAVMAVGTLLYAIGFGMYGFVASYFFFLLAMVIITVGEMFVSPVGQAIVARLAPEDMRGRYLAVYGFSWVIPMAVGPLLAGLLMDNTDPRWLWYAAGLLGLVAAGAFALQERSIGRSRWAAVDKRLGIIERLETGEITAVEAADLLQALESVGKSSMEQRSQRSGRRHLRIQISDQASGAIKYDMSLPVGLVNAAIYEQGRLADELDGVDAQSLKELVARGVAGPREVVMATDDQHRIEVSIAKEHPEESVRE